MHPREEEVAVAHHVLWCGEGREVNFGDFWDKCSCGARFLYVSEEKSWFTAHTLMLFPRRI